MATGESGVESIDEHDCGDGEPIGGVELPCADPDRFYIYKGVYLVLSRSGDLGAWGETGSGGVGLSLQEEHFVVYEYIFFMSNFEPRWRSATVVFFSTPAKILTDVKTVWVDDTACYAVKKDGTLWKWGDGAPVEVYWDGEQFADVREPEDQTGWTPRLVEYPGYWDEVLNNFGGSLRLRFYSDGSLVLDPEWSNVRLHDWAADPLNATPFEDIRSGDYYYVAVVWALDKGVTNGLDATHFGPDSTVTRGQAVTFLWRTMGRPEPTGKANPFEDVSQADYYYKPILWAVEKGITNGTDAAHFTPDQTCSTSHIVTFLYRTLGIGDDGWGAEGAAWAEREGLLADTGMAVDPGIDCPRSAVVTFLYRELG